jgi:Ankyrin repeats (3 copies)
MLTPDRTILNMPGPATAMLDLSKEFFVMHDDASTTSSTMSDASWSDRDDDMDISAVHHSVRSIGSLQDRRRVAPSRSTVSLGALMMNHERPISRQESQVNRSKHISMVNLGEAVKPAPLKAIQTMSAQACSPGDVAPNEYLCKLLNTKLDRVPYDSLPGYFLKTEPEHIKAWGGDLLRAVRTQNLEVIKDMRQSGKTLQACNQFGESILHVCVRRGTPEILNYLLRQASVSPRVHCENGRTPLHDAFWTFNGEEHSVKITALLLKECPEMLLITDKRGFTPLDYVPRSQWESCYKFLGRCLPLLAKLRNNGQSSA